MFFISKSVFLFKNRSLMFLRNDIVLWYISNYKVRNL